MGFSYLPQRAVSDNTKAAGLRIRDRIPDIKIVMEAHDALLFSIPISKISLWAVVIKEEMERPIDFSRCTLPRHELVIPCDVETGKNYMDLKKFKGFARVTQPTPIAPKTVTDAFIVR
jgi:DNA polymerase I-like protein with 3'-5' exonuclease and polymerase domains